MQIELEGSFPLLFPMGKVLSVITLVLVVYLVLVVRWKPESRWARRILQGRNWRVEELIPFKPWSPTALFSTLSIR